MKVEIKNILERTCTNHKPIVFNKVYHRPAYIVQERRESHKGKATPTMSNENSPVILSSYRPAIPDKNKPAI